MKNALTLTWDGTQHSLVMAQEDDLLVMLNVMKEKGEQHIAVILPPVVSLAMIEEAWEAQGEQWSELFVFKKPPLFIAVRVIWLPSASGCIKWDVLHLGGKPYDTCSFVPLTPSDWRHEFPATIVAVAAT